MGQAWFQFSPFVKRRRFNLATEDIRKQKPQTPKPKPQKSAAIAVVEARRYVSVNP